jgi:hypothetical protein
MLLFTPPFLRRSRPNSPSLGYEATSTQEFGDLIQFGGSSLGLTNISVVKNNSVTGYSFPDFGLSKMR